MNLALQLTIVRLLLIPFFILALLTGRMTWALAIFVVAGVTDALDGLIARLYRQKTELGAFLDPMADKLLLTAAFIILAMPDSPRLFPEFALVNRIPARLTILTISRDVFIVLIALVMHLTGGMRRFPPTLLSKINTAVQILTVSLVLLYGTLGMRSELLLPAFYRLTLLTTLLSGFHYIYRSARILAQPYAGAPSASAGPPGLPPP
jgi:cardiolipin synthase